MLELGTVIITEIFTTQVPWLILKIGCLPVSQSGEILEAEKPVVIMIGEERSEKGYPLFVV